MQIYKIYKTDKTIMHEGEADSFVKFVEMHKANLHGANLSGADLSGANLYGANLYGADLSGANLYGASLYGANLYGASLYGASLYGANLRGANLYGADLSGADLSGADLRGAKGISTFMAPTSRRICCAVNHGDHCMVQLGCFWGTEDEAIEAVKTKYGKTKLEEIYIRAIQSACEVARA